MRRRASITGTTRPGSYHRDGRGPAPGPAGGPENAIPHSRTIHDFSKYLVFYRPTQSGIEVVRVLHASRDIETLFGA
jgi:plasmid stabilization system protein ParE